jgi:hypothetical protein
LELKILSRGLFYKNVPDFLSTRKLNAAMTHFLLLTADQFGEIYTQGDSELGF